MITEINSIYNSDKKNDLIKLNGLLNLRGRIKSCQLEKDSSLMFLLQRIGVLYFKQANYTEAIDYTKESILIAKECIANNSCNLLPLVHNYFNLNYYYKSTGQLESTYAAIDSCIAYSLKESNGFDMAILVLVDKTDYLFNKGEYDLCTKNAKLGEDITQKYYHGKDSIQFIVDFIIKQANALYFSKKILAAEKLLGDKVLQFQQTDNSNQLASFYSLLGLINRDRQNYMKALSYFQKGYQTNSIIKFKKGSAQNLASIGILYAKNLYDYNKGLEYCTSALKYADATDSLFILQQKGNIYILKGMYDKAQYFFQQAFNSFQQDVDENILLGITFQNPSFNLLQTLSDLITDKGDAYVQQYYHTKNELFLKKALSVYKKGDLFLAKIKTEQQLQFSSNLVWRTTARNLYEHAIEACYAHKNIEDAFYFFEKSRAVLLNDQINEQRWMGDEDIARQAYIKKNITELEISLKTLPTSSPEYFTAQKELYTSSQELVVLIRSIKDKNPIFYQNYLDTAFMSIVQLQKNILNNSKTLIEIFSGDSAVYVLTIAPNNQSFIKIDKQLYDSLTNTFNSFVTNPAAVNKNFTGFVTTAQQLYKLLFQNKIPVDGSIIISPDGINFPFEALVVNKDNLKPDYLLNHCATSYTYSVKYLTNQFTINPNKSNGVLGMAPVRYNNFKQLSVLSGSDNSLRNIKNYFSNTTNFTFDKATKNNFLQNFPDYAVIQLYTHASDSSINNDPVIYFADSALYLSGLIPDRKPVTQLVILSACETANGKLYQGEGVFSFNRGFAALGIPAAISNLWSVDNQSTYSVTELFYKYLSQGLPTDIALQKAKMEFISSSSSKEKKLPYFWAGAILTGKVDTIKSSNGISWTAIIIGGIILLCFSYFVGKVLLKKKKISDYFVEIP